MRNWQQRPMLVPLLILAAAAAAFAQAPDYSTQIHPILTARCTACHSERLKQGNLALERHASAAAARAKILDRVQGVGGPRMPLNAAPLSDGEIALLRRWSEAGAPGPTGPEKQPWTAPLALKPTPRPAFETRESISDAHFARRAYLDVWGLLPTPYELDAFERDPRPDKRARLIDALLSNDRRYAAHWISFWNDHLRNDEGVVYHGERQSITRWLLKALESNLSYDRMVRTLLDPPEKSGAEGFLIGVNWRGDINASQRPVMQAAQNSAQVFLGVNLKCNSCHDSFINQWKLKDAYGLASFFSDEPLELYRCDAPTGERATLKFLYPELGGIASDAPLAAKRAKAAELFTSPANGRTPRTLVNRYWRALMGQGIVPTLDDMDAEPANPQLLDWLAYDFVSHGWDLKHLIRTIMTSPAYASPQRRRLTAEQFADAVSSLTGEWRVLTPRAAGPALYAREWQLKSSPLTRALGRPIRDQVVTERINAPTTLEALEVANGSTLAAQLSRGARRLMGLLREPPKPLFDSGIVNSQKVEIDIPLKNAKRLWLLVEDVDSYDPARVRAAWANLSLAAPNGAVLFKGDEASTPATLAKVPSTLVLETGGATHLRATVGVDAESLASDINPRIRFFVFAEEPDRERLIPPDGLTPAQLPAGIRDADALISNLYRHALSRPPNPREHEIAREFLASGSPEGLEDLLWSILLSPEFQYVR